LQAKHFLQSESDSVWSQAASARKGDLAPG